MLSSAAYLTSAFPDRGQPTLVTPDLLAAIKALNESAHAAMRAARGHAYHHDLMQMRLFTEQLVSRATVAPAFPVAIGKEG